MSRRLTLHTLQAALFAFFIAGLAFTETIRVKGSDTIGGALGPDLAETYHEENPATFIEWEALGSSTAFVGLFDGSTQLGASSRPINEAEQREAKRLGLRLREWVIAYDGIVLLVHPSNPLPSLSLDQASRIFQGKIRNFKEVGGPDRPIEIVARPSYSGTHAFFKEKVLRKGNSKGPEEFAESTRFIEHSAAIVDQLAANPNAISFLGLGWAKPSIRAVPVAGKSGSPKVASVESIRDGSYPIFRPLYLYSNGEPQAEARNLLGFILSEAGQRQVAENGFVRTDMATTLAYAPARTAPQAPAAVVANQTPSATVGANPAAASAPVAASTAPKLMRIFFSFGGARIADEAELKIVEAARILASNSFEARVVGHADAQGTKAANERVSAARAGAVYQELRRLGVPSHRLSVTARGADEPIGTNVTLEGRRENRRVDILFVETAPRIGG